MLIEWSPSYGRGRERECGWVQAERGKKPEKEELTVANLSTTITFIIPLSHPVYLQFTWILFSYFIGLNRYMYTFFHIYMCIEIEPKVQIIHTPPCPAIHTVSMYVKTTTVKRFSRIIQSREHQHKKNTHTHQLYDPKFVLICTDADTWEDWYEAGDFVYRDTREKVWDTKRKKTNQRKHIPNRMVLHTCTPSHIVLGSNDGMRKTRENKKTTHNNNEEQEA